MIDSLSAPAAHHARARLVERLERLASGESACDAFLLTELAAAAFDMDALRDLLASIGAVRHAGGWRLSDGAPPGWWWQLTTEDGAEEHLLTNSWDARSYIASVSRAGWHVQHPSGLLIDAQDRREPTDDSKRAALRVCRLHGLFAREAVTA